MSIRKLWHRTKDNVLSSPYGLSFILFVLAVIPGGIGAKVMLLVVPSYSSAPVAAITEPITTKFLPAYVSLYLATSEAYQQFLRRPILFGVWGGLAFGLAERVMYVLDGTSPHLLWTVSVGLHGVFGILAAGTLYWRGKEPWNKSDMGLILFGIFATATVHYVWNIVIV
jgi:hypothetical protein